MLIDIRKVAESINVSKLIDTIAWAKVQEIYRENNWHWWFGGVPSFNDLVYQASQLLQSWVSDYQRTKDSPMIAVDDEYLVASSGRLDWMLLSDGTIKLKLNHNHGGQFSCWAPLRIDDRTKVIGLIKEAKRIYESDISWEDKYDQIFSKNISVSIRYLLNALGVELYYCDPDTSYEEDVRAYMEAIIGILPDLEKTGI